MKNSYLFVILLIISGVLIFAKCNHADNIGDQMKLMKMIDFRRSLDKPINYFGRVVDLQGNPISNAKAVVHIGRASGMKIALIPTDTDGRFEITGIDGSDLLVTEIKAQGYEYLASNRADGHSGYENDGSRVIERNNPIIFTLRKKEPPTVVIPGDISVTFKKDVKFYEVDLVDMVDGTPGYLKRNHSDNAHTDLKARVEYISAEDAYNFILETPDADSGMIALDQMLYVPPETGYKNIYKVKVTNGQIFKTYLYIKSRGGGIYSRLEIKFVNQNGEVYFAAEAWTNPLGERNLDYDGDKYMSYLANKNASAERMGPKPQ